MAKTTKTSGYLVKIEAFVPADMTNIETLRALQDAVKRMSDALKAYAHEDPSATITPTRR